MKWFRVEIGGDSRVGFLIDNGDGVLLPRHITDVADIVGDARAMAASAGAERVRPDAHRLLSPIGRFRRDVLCTGWNYWEHFAEGIGKRNDDVTERPAAPTFFTKSPGAVIGPADPIAFDPRVSQKWDYEGELAVIIGRAGRSIPADRAMEHVFGFCLANDVSARDLQRRHGGQWLKGKSIDRTMPLGPYIVTRDEIDLAEVRLECLVNGELRQNALVSQMAFPLPDLIAELSFGMTLGPGDVLLTGTPSGVGYARTPPLFLRAGDEIVVRGTGLGELRNTVTQVDLFGQSSVILEAGAS
jgi:2,4-didehydro-3-deoxy-L-rhamnonate hydrolase